MDLKEDLRKGVEIKMEIKIEEKEKRALENVKSLLLYSSEHEYFSPFKEEEIDDMNIVLNLVSNLIAENKELKENSISKSKVQGLIDEINKAYENSKDEYGESEYYYPDYTIEKLQSLLGKE